MSVKDEHEMPSLGRIAAGCFVLVVVISLGWGVAKSNEAKTKRGSVPSITGSDHSSQKAGERIDSLVNLNK